MMFLFGFIFLVCAAAMAAWIFKLSVTERNLTDLVAKTEAEAKRVEALQAEVAAAQAKIPPVKAKTDYIKEVLNYNEVLPKLYEDITKYTYNRIEYKSINASGQQLSISAHARTIGDCGRYLLNMYRAGHLFRSVSISAIPGWPAGSTGSSGGGMMGGMMGGMPTMPGGMTGGMLGGMPPMPGMNAGSTGGISGGNSSKSTISRGFDFTVTCALVKSISAPAYVKGGSADATGGAASPMGGMPGMMPGAAGGMPGGMPGYVAPGAASTGPTK